jgi:hypothetical protein
MNKEVHRSHPSWRAAEARVFRPALVLVALAAVGVLLVEVWQSSRMAQLSYALDASRAELTHANARLEFARARIDRGNTRAALDRKSDGLGLVPADANQIVQLPSEYLADATPTRPAGDDGPSLLALAVRASHALVPDATARGRETRN